MNAIGNNVYVLGAGFSAFANMPCIDEFLERMQDLREFSDKLSEGAKSAINTVLAERSKAANVREKIKFNLDNIEQLFSLIDAAGGVTVGQTLNNSQKAIRKAISATLLGSTASRRMITLSTASPTRLDAVYPLIPGAEKIPDSPAALNVDPYVLFAAVLAHRLDTINSNLAVSDIVISFNYDLVLEQAFRLLSINADYCLPEAEYPTDIKPDSHSPKLIKLHGSINWGLHGSTSEGVRVFNNPIELVDDDDRYPVLLPPTWDKGAFVRTLASVWSKGIEALRNATRLILVGYSIPEGDNHFRYFLASGLRDNHSLRKLVIVNPADLSSRYGSFLDDTYFSKRIVTLKGFSGLPGGGGVKFEELIANSLMFSQTIGRGYHLREADW
jgi:hypothetical protein